MKRYISISTLTKQLTVISMMVMACFLVACQDDTNETTEHGKYPLYLKGSGNSLMQDGGTVAYVKRFTREPGAGLHPFVPGTPDGGAAPSGVSTYSPYNELYPLPINKDFTTIGAFLVQDSKDNYGSVSGFFRYQEDNKWSTTVGVNVGDYFLFGYMPSNAGNSATVRKRDDIATTTWADGCKMVISNLSTVTPADVCVVVGVKKWDNGTTAIYEPSVVENLRQGQYAYEGTTENNYVYLLLDHLYTNVNLELSVDPDYATLRTIKLKKVSLISQSKDHVDVTVILDNSATKPIKSVEYVWSLNSNEVNTVLFAKDDAEAVEVSHDPEHPTSVPGYFAPGSTTQQFTYEFVYDVYDRYGNLVRKDAKAVNKWNIPGEQVFAGRSFKVKATVIPTYLYMLSEPDLDNPTVRFN